jgi:hypothetical protein
VERDLEEAGLSCQRGTPNAGKGRKKLVILRGRLGNESCGGGRVRSKRRREEAGCNPGGRPCQASVDDTNRQAGSDGCNGHGQADHPAADDKNVGGGLPGGTPVAITFRESRPVSDRENHETAP